MTCKIKKTVDRRIEKTLSQFTTIKDQLEQDVVDCDEELVDLEVRVGELTRLKARAVKAARGIAKLLDGE